MEYVFLLYLDLTIYNSVKINSKPKERKKIAHTLFYFIVEDGDRLRKAPKK